MSTFKPACWKRSFRRFALDGSFNVAMMTIGAPHSAAVTANIKRPRSARFGESDAGNPLGAQTHMRLEVGLPASPPRWKPVIQHQVDENPRNRNIQPDWHRPS